MTFKCVLHIVAKIVIKLTLINRNILHCASMAKSVTLLRVLEFLSFSGLVFTQLYNPAVQLKQKPVRRNFPRLS